MDQTVEKLAKTKEYRTILKYYFKFLIETGVRPGEEVKHLKFSNFKRSTNDYGETEVFCIDHQRENSPAP
ncbi:hypothetical protein OA92_20230 [Marinomonas sp. SBI22]|uniref:hypothetical protein n=1 Tax=unclassified Marinomonas TaxID=196814 RepID=UPI0007AFCB3C|nr:MULTISPECIES: hypothetical protein [unclassified Marinomonas]KZM39230.1 hypothetical protein OA92_20230 [Marinomonas sp. SBI22]KZM40223.1 hypothetical protein OA91_20630 [Marinomonas sp. SBI8L]